MYFITADLSFWYDLNVYGKFDLKLYEQWIKRIIDLGFDCVAIDESLFPLCYDVLRDYNIDILFAQSCGGIPTKMPDGTYSVESWRNENDCLSNEIIIDTTSKLVNVLNSVSHLTKYFQYENKITYFNHLGVYLESVFLIKSRKDILEGNFIKEHDKMIEYFYNFTKISNDFGYFKQLFPAQIQGFGANKKVLHELDSSLVCEEALKILKPENFCYFTPTQMSHDSKYLATNLILQSSLKKRFGVKFGWGAMGLLGFPITSSVAYFNNIDTMYMITNEFTYGKKRLTFYGYDDVSSDRIELIKRTIKSIKNNKSDEVKNILRKYSKQATKNTEFGLSIFDEHFSFDGMI